MRKYIRSLFQIYVFIQLNLFSSVIFAGSYEDFFTALHFDDSATVSRLLQRGFDPNTPNENGIPALVLAARESSFNVMQALLGAPKLKVEARNEEDESALMLVSLRGNVDIAQRLIEKDADVNKTGWTPLHYAATGGHTPLIELLLQHHAYIDAESPNGTTPLMMAAQYGSTEAVRLLIQRGADVTLKNQLQLNALDFARLGSRPDAIQILQSALKSSASGAK
ncbi:MAG: ankyrin repeat domain-containing protein [Burkholderiaceae bacterium]